MQASDSQVVSNISASAPKQSMKERKQYLKKSGKSLWMKNKLKKSNAISVDVSTMSTDGSCSFYETKTVNTTVSLLKSFY